MTLRRYTIRKVKVNEVRCTEEGCNCELLLNCCGEVYAPREAGVVELQYTWSDPLEDDYWFCLGEPQHTIPYWTYCSGRDTGWMQFGSSEEYDAWLEE